MQKKVRAAPRAEMGEKLGKNLMACCLCRLMKGLVFSLWGNSLQKIETFLTPGTVFLKKMQSLLLNFEKLGIEFLAIYLQ